MPSLSGGLSNWRDPASFFDASTIAVVDGALDEAMASAAAVLEQHVARVDPLARLLDPSWTETAWEYDGSHIGPVPGQLHPKQLEALHSHAKHRFLFWGNQTGKTTVGAIECSLLALGRHPTHQKWPPGITIWASALTWELWENNLLPELLTWLPADRVIDAPPARQKSTKRAIKVRADNGKVSWIVGKAAQQGPALYQSARVHVVWMDEEHPRAIWEEVWPRLLRFGGITVTTATPLKGLTWIFHDIYEPWQRGLKPDVFTSHAGMADNPGISEEERERYREELKHNPTLLAARFFGQFVRPAGLVLPYDKNKHLVPIGQATLLRLLTKGRVYAGIDFGAWRFAFVVGIVDPEGRLWIVHEYFSQREDTETRAGHIHRILSRFGAPRGTKIAGDCANPQEIIDANKALRTMGSVYRIVPVANENKARLAGAQRVESMLNRGAMYFDGNIGEGMLWLLGYNASSPGKPVLGSRLLWEITNWRFPKTEDGKLQKDDPDDATADGADMMAALRYMVMTWLSAPVVDERKEVSAFAPERLQEAAEALLRDNAPPPAGAKLFYLDEAPQ
jgi:phage terminase large subunit-like protein